MSTTRRAVIFANGVLTSQPAALAAISAGDIVIAADGGARHCSLLGITPDYIIGDFDSLETQELQRFQDAGSKVIRHPARKDYTDLELALRHACSLGATEIVVLGALGARWDQSLANLLLPASDEFSKAQVRLLDDNQEVLLLRGGDSITIGGAPGDTLSLIPLTGDATGVRTSGLEYPLQGETLAFGSTRGISNVLLAEEASISLQDGLLLCVIIHAKTDRERT